MNRGEALDWLVENITEWPTCDVRDIDIVLPESLAFGFSNIDRTGIVVVSTQLTQEKMPIIRRTDWKRAVISGGMGKPANQTPTAPSKYHVKNIWQNCEYIDFYQMYDMYKLGKPHEVGDSAIEHAWKKITVAGNRSGGKSKLQDLREAVDSLNRAIDDIESMQLSGNSG